MAIQKVHGNKTGFEIYDKTAEVIVRVIYNDTVRGTKTFSFSFGNETREKCFGQSENACFGYDADYPTRLYFGRGERGDYKLNRPKTTKARWYARATNLYKLVEAQGLCNADDFNGRYMVEYSKADDMYYIDCKKRVV